MIEDDNINTREFVEMLYIDFLKEPVGNDMLREGRRRGWLEDMDETKTDDTLTRKSAARILHEFLKKEYGIRDIEDIKKAEELKDLYDCRVCANHIAQVYLRGLMEARNPGVLIFDSDSKIGRDEALKIKSELERFLK